MKAQITRGIGSHMDPSPGLKVQKPTSLSAIHNLVEGLLHLLAECEDEVQHLAPVARHILAQRLELGLVIVDAAQQHTTSCILNFLHDHIRFVPSHSPYSVISIISNKHTMNCKEATA